MFEGPLQTDVGAPGCDSSRHHPRAVSAWVSRFVRRVQGFLAGSMAKVAAQLCVVILMTAIGADAARAGPETMPCTMGTPSPQPVGTDPSRSQPIACSVAQTGGVTPTQTTLSALFGNHYRQDGKEFAKHVNSAHSSLGRTVHDWSWVSRAAPQDGRDHLDAPGWMLWVSGFTALLVRYWLWIMVGLLLAFVLYHHKAWMSWLSEATASDSPAPIDTRLLEAPVVLPADVPAAVRALWQRGEQRAALALFYQAAIQRLADGLGAPLPPGATEGECLARSRQLSDRKFAGLFVRIVSCWQAAAYARHMPDFGMIEGLLTDWGNPARAVA
jgi:hypothetical protein